MIDGSITTPAGTIATRTWGRPGAQRILALHGWLDNAASFDHLAPALVEAGLDAQIVAIDLPGHGLSDHRPGSAEYHFIDMVADVHRVADSLAWPRFCLLGHSMGAAVSSLYAGTFPSRVQSLVLLEGLGPLTDDHDAAPDRLARAIEGETARVPGSKRVFASIDEAAARVMLAAPMAPESARTLLRRGLVAVEGGLSWRADARLRRPSRLRLTEGHVLAFFRRIRAPTLVVRAREGWPTVPAVMAARLAAIEGATLVELAGRHHIHLDDASAVAGQLIPWWRGLADSADGGPPAS